MRARCRVALVAALSCLPWVSGAQQPSEGELVALIVRDGPRARAIRAATEIVVAEQAARRAFPNPMFQYSRESAGFTEFYQAEQPLPAFGLRDALERAGVAAREATDAERDALLWRLRNDAYESIARLRAATERIEAADAIAAMVEQLIGVLRTREKEGEGSRFDRVRAEQEFVETRQIAATAAIERADARGALTAMLPPGIPVPERFGVRPETGDAAPIDALTARAGASRAELRALQNAMRRYSEEAEAAGRAAGPAAVVSGGVKRADELGTTKTGAVVGVGVSLPIFNRGAREAARWNAERARAELERAALEAAVHAQVASAAEALALRRTAAERAVAAATSANELIAIANVAYREGEIGILQVLDAYRTVGRSQERAIAATLDVRLAQIALERAVGVTLWP